MWRHPQFKVFMMIVVGALLLRAGLKFMEIQAAFSQSGAVAAMDGVQHQQTLYEIAGVCLLAILLWLPFRNR